MSPVSATLSVCRFRGWLYVLVFWRTPENQTGVVLALRWSYRLGVGCWRAFRIRDDWIGMTFCDSSGCSTFYRYRYVLTSLPIGKQSLLLPYYEYMATNRWWGQRA